MKGSVGPMIALLSVAMFLQCLNSSLITVPLPQISADLGIGVSSSSWLLLAYSIGTCALLLQFTKYAKNGRTRKFFVYGLILFLFASFDCWLAEDYLTLVVLRFVQGAAISMSVATGPVFVVQNMPENVRGRALGSMAAGTGLAMAIGPSVGGVLAETISWHMLFLINIPLGLAALGGALLVLPADTMPKGAADPHWTGSVAWFLLISFSMMFLENLFTWSAAALFVSGFIAFESFVILAWNVSTRKEEQAIVSRGLIGTRTFKLVAASAAIGSMITEGAFYLLPYFMEISWGMDVTECGIYFCLVSATTFASAKAAGRYCDARSSRAPVLASFVCTLAFDVIFLLLEPGSGLALLVLSACMVGASFAVFETAQYLRMMRNTEKQYKEEAATMITVLTYVGASLGLILYSLVFDMAVPAARSGMEGLSPSAMTDGFHATAVLGLVLGLIGLALAFRVPDDKTVENDGERP